MADRETVLQGLKQCKNINGNCNMCPYNTIDFGIQICTTRLCRDAYELLTEQDKEPLEPITAQDKEK